MKHKGTIILETKRLILRPFSLGDIESTYYNWASDPKVTEFLGWPKHENITVTRQVIEDWIKKYEDKSFYQWAIVLKEIDQVIGSISVVEMDPMVDSVHIGYCIGSRWWKQGYTSEALARLIVFFFDQVGVKRIESQHDPNNPGSGRVMEKCGMTLEGNLRQADWSNKGIVDACIYGILAEDYYKDKKIIGEDL